MHIKELFVVLNRGVFFFWGGGGGGALESLFEELLGTALNP